MLIAGKFEFQGPYPDGTNFNNVPAVYVVINGQRGLVLDVGETERLSDRLSAHERRPCWGRHASLGIYFAVLKEESQTTRLTIEKAVRDYYSPPCGDR